MSLRTLAVLLLTFFSLHAGKLITPHEAIVQTYGKNVTIAKKNLQLDKQTLQAVSKQAKTKLKTSKFHAYAISIGKKTVAHALLITQTVRTKSASVLYMIDINGKIRAVEIVAFKEPSEFIPSDTWLMQFKQKSAADPLRLERDIPNISGATMSTRIITDGSRVALALFHTVLKK